MLSRVFEMLLSRYMDHKRKLVYFSRAKAGRAETIRVCSSIHGVDQLTVGKDTNELVADRVPKCVRSAGGSASHDNRRDRRDGQKTLFQGYQY